MTPPLPTSTSVLLVLLAEHAPCSPAALRSLAVEHLPGSQGPTVDELDDESDRLVGLGLVRRDADGLGLTPAGHAAASAWLYGDGRSPEHLDEERVLRFALLFAAAAREAGPG
ncbi:hypothetical protein [Actinomycetospora flava]|uniref:Uncharacterized protein n=1 Tax=Actinomycetospora flava TaxID=3129232 RepID=A0ABU8MEW9_9PSEU